MSSSSSSSSRRLLKQQGSRGEKKTESSRVLLDRFFNLEEIKAFTLLHHALMLSCSRKKRNSITPEAVHEKKNYLTREHFASRWEEVDDAFFIENFQGVSPLDLEYFMDWKYGGVPPPMTSHHHFPRSRRAYQVGDPRLEKFTVYIFKDWLRSLDDVEQQLTKFLVQLFSTRINQDNLKDIVEFASPDQLIGKVLKTKKYGWTPLKNTPSRDIFIRRYINLNSPPNEVPARYQQRVNQEKYLRIKHSKEIQDQQLGKKEKALKCWVKDCKQPVFIWNPHNRKHECGKHAYMTDI
jgi:hypothetical protein